ncbi:MAG: sn-glycerol-1-phosphate dehydrogenase [Pseudomonadota bacterium]
MPNDLAAMVAASPSVDSVHLGEGALQGAPALIAHYAAGRPVLLVADENTAAAAAPLMGAFPAHVLKGRPAPTVVLARAIGEALGEAMPVAVGAGVINDVVRFAAFEAGRPFVSVATAASMDGYASAGAPLSEGGFKKTLQCCAPVAIVADTAVIARAPARMGGWGFADVAGKIPAGGDWILADGLGIEPIDDAAWPMVQGNLARWLADPDGILAGSPDALAALTEGLIVSGLAMERHGSSRPASGADHQIAHLWEMEGLAHGGEKVSHGACVAIGTLATLALYDALLAMDFATLDPAAAAARAPTMDDKRAEIEALLAPSLAGRALEETAAKHLAPAALADRLRALKAVWPELRARLETHLPRREGVAAMLARAGAPVRAAEIGVDPARLLRTVRAARYLRSRYTILDLLTETGRFERALPKVAAVS